MGVYLRAKFDVSSIILTSFRQGVILALPPQNELLKKPPRLGLMQISKIYFEMQYITKYYDVQPRDTKMMAL